MAVLGNGRNMGIISTGIFSCMTDLFDFDLKFRLSPTRNYYLVKKDLFKEKPKRGDTLKVGREVYLIISVGSILALKDRQDEYGIILEKIK